MNMPNKQSGNALLIVILVLIILILLFMNSCHNLRYPGGTAHSIQLRPITTTLAPGVPTTFHVQLILNHPLPQIRKTFTVNIDEDDFWDDELIGSLEVVYDPNDPSRPYAHATFQLQCDDLQADGEFDLSAPGEGSSADEVVHLVHAEGPGNNSPNISIRCAVPVVTEDEEESEDE